MYLTPPNKINNCPQMRKKEKNLNIKLTNSQNLPARLSLGELCMSLTPSALASTPNSATSLDPLGLLSMSPSNMPLHIPVPYPLKVL